MAGWTQDLHWTFPASKIDPHALLDVSVTTLLLALWPLFALIVAGYFLRPFICPGAGIDRRQAACQHYLRAAAPIRETTDTACLTARW